MELEKINKIIKDIEKKIEEIKKEEPKLDVLISSIEFFGKKLEELREMCSIMSK